MTSVEKRIRARIRAGGPIPFADFMEEALYGEGGYYNREELPIGEGGDYVTGSSHSPLFAEATARVLERLDAVVGGSAESDYLEAGYGSGAHLATLARSLDGTNRRLMAWDRVRRAVPPGCQGLEGLRDLEVKGLIFSYELFDALPVHRLIRREEGMGELWVDLSATGELEWSVGELSSPDLADLVGSPLRVGQIADLAPGWRPLYRRLAEALEWGVLLTFDYGFRAEKLLDPRMRAHGTLACYRRQRVHRNPFVAVGEQDLTAHVDFSALVEEGEKAGLETLILTRQAPWLVAFGLLDGLEERGVAARAEAGQLADLGGMGEEIRVLAQARGVSSAELLPEELLRGRRSSRDPGAPR